MCQEEVVIKAYIKSSEAGKRKVWRGARKDGSYRTKLYHLQMRKIHSIANSGTIEGTLRILQSPMVTHVAGGDINMIPITIVTIAEDKGIVGVNAEHVPGSVTGVVFRPIRLH